MEYRTLVDSAVRRYKKNGEKEAVKAEIQATLAAIQVVEENTRARKEQFASEEELADDEAARRQEALKQELQAVTDHSDELEEELRRKEAIYEETAREMETMKEETEKVRQYRERLRKAATEFEEKMSRMIAANTEARLKRAAEPVWGADYLLAG